MTKHISYVVVKWAAKGEAKMIDFPDGPALVCHPDNWEEEKKKYVYYILNEYEPEITLKPLGLPRFDNSVDRLRFLGVFDTPLTVKALR